MLLDAVWAVQGEKRPKRSYVRNSHSDVWLKADACVAGRLRRWLARGGRLPRVARSSPSTAGMLLDAVIAMQGEKGPKRSYVRNSHCDLWLEADACVAGRLGR